MPFSKAHFIKPNIPFDPAYRRKNNAPLFRKTFELGISPTKAELSICGLGYAYCFINGKKITDDMFCAPVSDYRKTLWYVKYDVTSLLSKGNNAVSVICGNGWYNEEFPSSWNHNEAEWRDLPKFILSLEIDGTTAMVSDENWKCLPETAIVFNALRSGETFDARLWDEKMLTAAYNDSQWSKAIIDTNAPRGVFRQCICEPIREHEVFAPVSIIQTQKNKFVYDMGQNLSGYARLTAKCESGREITLRYAEVLTDDNRRELNHMDRFFKESDIQTDRFICSGEEMTWSPMFTYHGFRYIEVEGINSPDEITLNSVFVHQAIKKRTEFECSDQTINALFSAGQKSTYSNMFYLLSDCPSREKMGWMNDAQMSAEQICTDFFAELFFKKWLIDIYDAQRDDGALPGIVPTPAWGFTWGNGPVSDGALFEIPYRLWLHSGDSSPLIASIPYFERYLKYLESLEDTDGHIFYGLDDWAPPHTDSLVPSTLINDILRIKFYRIYIQALTLDNRDIRTVKCTLSMLEKRVISDWINDKGYCIINELTAISMLIVHGLYDSIAPLAQQIKTRFEELDFHHNCGMVGMRHLPDAFNICGLEEYAMKLLTVHGFPSYCHWLDNDATTLWEKWFLDNSHGSNSRNHHMYSHFMAWLVSTVLGICHDKTKHDTPEFTLSPYYFSELEYAKGSYLTDGGKLSVEWNRHDDKITLTVIVSGDVKVLYRNLVLTEGEHKFVI